MSKYYSRPVWFLNGLFIQTDEISINHRKSIVEYFKNRKRLKILDHGGGFGTLAKEISKQTLSSKVDIFEPHASDYTYENIKVIRILKYSII